MKFRMSLIMVSLIVWITAACATLPSTEETLPGQAGASPEVALPSIVPTDVPEIDLNGSPTPASAAASPAAVTEAVEVQDSPVIEETAMPIEVTAADIEARVRADLSSYLKLDAAQIETVSIEERTWLDGVRSCVAQKGMFETPRPVPGWRILVRAEGNEYEYRAGRDGTFVRCPRVSKPIDPIR